MLNQNEFDSFFINYKLDLKTNIQKALLKIYCLWCFAIHLTCVKLYLFQSKRLRLKSSLGCM